MPAEYKGTSEPAQRNGLRLRRHNGPRDNPTIRPGMLVCTINTAQFRWYQWSNPDGIHPGIYNHPGVILDVQGNDVHFLVISTISLKDRDASVRMQHLPIFPMDPHPDTGEQLWLKEGECHKPGYVKVHEVWILPIRILLKNCDPITGVELELQPESFDYVKEAVARYDWDQEKKHQPLRPFDGFPGVVDLHPSPPETPFLPYNHQNQSQDVQRQRQPHCGWQRPYQPTSISNSHHNQSQEFRYRSNHNWRSSHQLPPIPSSSHDIRQQDPPWSATTANPSSSDDIWQQDRPPWSATQTPVGDNTDHGLSRQNSKSDRRSRTPTPKKRDFSNDRVPNNDNTKGKTTISSDAKGKAGGL